MSGEQIKLKTFRFIYSNDFITELEYFSKIHQYDDRKTFKEEWTNWIKEDKISELILRETENSISQGYNGDIMDKMFKSARYYYRKKNKKEQEDEDDDENDEKNFAGLSKDMMKLMDQHIKIIINQYIDKATAISLVNPATAFDEFCKTHTKEITDEIFRLKDKIILKPNEVSLKFKKSYKNRFYKIRVILNN